MAKDKLKNFPPEERIKRLKELEKKKKAEIADAEQQIRKSHEEISERKKWAEQVPIPEIGKEDLSDISEEGKEILKIRKGLKEKTTEDTEVEKSSKEELSLEETLAGEKISQTATNIEYGPTHQQPGIEYGITSQKPMGLIYQEASQLKQTIESKGYISRADERKAEYLSGIVEERIQAAEEGKYSFTEQTARAASLTKMIGTGVQHAYKSGSRVSSNDWYRG